MKTLLFIWLLSLTVYFSTAQQITIDSIKHELAISKNDTMRLVLYSLLINQYANRNYDSGLFFSRLKLQLAKKLKYKVEIADALLSMGGHMQLLNDSKTLQVLLEGLKITMDSCCEKYDILPKKYLDKMPAIASLSPNQLTPDGFKEEYLGAFYYTLGNFYTYTMENWPKSLVYYHKASNHFRSEKDTGALCLTYDNIAMAYQLLDKLDSALIYIQRSYDLGKQKDPNYADAYALVIFGTIYFKKGNYPLALNYSRQAIKESQKVNLVIPEAFLTIANIFFNQSSFDSSLYYAQKTFEESKKTGNYVIVPKACLAIAKAYKSKNNVDSSYKYLEISFRLTDSLNTVEKIRQFYNEDNEEQIHQQEIIAAQAELKNRIKIYALIAGIAVLSVMAFFLLRNNLQRKKNNLLLQRQKDEIETQKNKVETTLTELKSTQAQLIHSEKMASLGELTAGIAHEIQNPLNFVNNFSELNKELIEELNAERLKPNAERNGQLENEILNDLKENQEKINHHGKRADAIVKGMLQHSRSSSGIKEPTDINALADEYLRLAYHGLRAKDKSFNAKFEINLDPTIEKINVVPQDIGRVILNLINNAFYAVSEKKKELKDRYEPTVLISTKKLDGKIEIKVEDNGNGIPQKVLDKIFQPFFTTKPTGQGTGLGLSLSYDIIKSQGGEIKVETEEGRGSAFIIQLTSKS